MNEGDIYMVWGEKDVEKKYILVSKLTEFDYEEAIKELKKLS